MIKVPENLGMWKNISQHNKGNKQQTYSLHHDKLNAFPSKSGTRQGFAVPPLLLEIFARAIWQVKIKHRGKCSSKKLLFATDGEYRDLYQSRFREFGVPNPSRCIFKDISQSLHPELVGMVGITEEGVKGQRTRMSIIDVSYVWQGSWTCEISTICLPKQGLYNETLGDMPVWMRKIS